MLLWPSPGRHDNTLNHEQIILASVLDPDLKSCQNGVRGEGHKSLILCTRYRSFGLSRKHIVLKPGTLTSGWSVIRTHAHGL